ncbi:MAG: DUF1413 domain-containing protein [Fusobacteriaceae bacterium]
MNFLQSAINELQNVNAGTKFVIKDLFVGHQWNSIKISDRKTLGILFLEFAKQNPTMIDILIKNSSNHQEYLLK